MHIVLIKPQIPQNTGSIARTCAATEIPLHIIGPTPFEITDKQAKRAGLDYWPYVNLTKHKSWEEYYNSSKPKNVWLLTKFAEKYYYDVNFTLDDALVFGSETTGLGQAFLSTFPQEQQLKIPMSCSAVRSLNLSNAVSIVLFEALRQLRYKRK